MKLTQESKFEPASNRTFRVEPLLKHQLSATDIKLFGLESL